MGFDDWKRFLRLRVYIVLEDLLHVNFILQLETLLLGLNGGQELSQVPHIPLQAAKWVLEWCDASQIRLSLEVCMWYNKINVIRSDLFTEQKE